MAVISMKALLEAGVHFGHRSRRWHPKMRPFIFTERNGIHIIDLQQTIARLETAYAFVRDLAAEGGTILFVGTKKQAQENIKAEAERCGMPYVVNRWLGGMLTNFRTVRQRTDYMIRLEEEQRTGEWNRLPKKEALGKARELARLLERFDGIRNMVRLPDALFIADVNREYIAVKEANTLGIPIVALVDTNCDPDPIDYIIPANDDAIRAIKLLASKIADAVIEGRQMRGVVMAEEGAPAEAEGYIAEVAAQYQPVDASLPRVYEPDLEEELSDEEMYDEAEEDLELEEDESAIGPRTFAPDDEQS